jgi:2-hydroxy-6-oxonona-2,4-dienedioate hydrolase
VRNVLPLAEAGWRVIAPDLPGFGDSAAPEGVRDADGMVAPVRDGLAQIVGEVPVTLVAFSFGSLVASLYAAQHPERVARLVIVGAPGLGLRDARLKLYDWRHLPTQQERDAVHRRNLGILMLRDPAAIDETAVRIQAANLPRDRMRRRRLALTDILARTLPTLKCRVDAIYGEEDALYRELRGELQALLRSIATVHDVVFVPGAGHWLQYEHPAAFLKALTGLVPSPPGRGLG